MDVAQQTAISLAAIVVLTGINLVITTVAVWKSHRTEQVLVELLKLAQRSRRR